MIFLLLIAVSVLVLLLGVFALFQPRRDPAVLYFFLTMLGASVWSFGIAVFLTSDNISILQNAATIYYVAAALIAVSIAPLALSVALRGALAKKMIMLLFIPFMVIAGTILVAPGVMIDSVSVAPEGGNNSAGLVGWSYAVYSIYFLSYYLIGLIVLFLSMIRAKVGKRVRFAYLFGAYLVAGAIGAWFNLILPGLGDYSLIWAGPLGLLIFVPVVYVAIAKHGLFDIRHAASRTLAYTFTLLALAGFYSLLVGGLYRWIFEKDVVPGQFGINIIVTLVLVFMFQPIKRFFDRITNSIFYRDRYSKDEFYARVSDVLTSTTELRRLMQRISHLIGTTLRAEQVSFFVYRSQTKYTSAGTDGHAKVSIQDARLLDELILAAGLQDSGPIVAERLASEGVEQKLYRFMISYKLGVILPLMQADEMIGYVFMGRHRAGSYAARDILVLTTIADELVIAIQNVLSVQEVRELNETLQQRIDDATKELRASNAQLRRLDEAKDEFVSMASHQLRTPLTSVKGYIDMMLEGDAGEITPMQRQFLTEAFVSSDRMVHLINDFLNVSRLQTGKFVIDKRPVDLAKLVSQEIEGLRISAEGRKLSFEYAAPTNLPKLLLDEGKIRQVVMNFADNALYYSKPNTKIIVNLRLEEDSVVCTVKDTGIGVPLEEQERLFTKFYRASNAKKQRPDGTGVGLFLAKRVIVAHGGSVIFSSVEGKGSTFGFRLPLKTLRAASDANKLDNK